MSLTTKKLLFLAIPAIIVWVIDQVTKHWVRYSLELHRYEIIEGWLAFNYTQNPGMALGMDWISTPTISIIAILATIGILAYILKTLEHANFGYLVCMGLIIGGAIGNITDRLVMGYIEGYGGVLEGHVIDFIHFTLTINDNPVFPYIFNVADMAISTSIIVMLIFHKKIMPVTADEKKEESDAGAEAMVSEPESDGHGGQTIVRAGQAIKESEEAAGSDNPAGRMEAKDEYKDQGRDRNLKDQEENETPESHLDRLDEDQDGVEEKPSRKRIDSTAKNAGSQGDHDQDITADTEEQPVEEDSSKKQEEGSK